MCDPVNGFHPGTEEAPRAGISACWLVSNIPKALRNDVWREERQRRLSVSPGLSHIRPTLAAPSATFLPVLANSH